jgi:hypothetical protein
VVEIEVGGKMSLKEKEASNTCFILNTLELMIFVE